jgi:uncharacterized protein YciI
MRTFSKPVNYLFAAVLLASTVGVQGQTPTPIPTPRVGKESTVKDIRYVVFHTPGPKWQPGKGMFEQDGLQAHVAHYRKLLDSGQLVMGGPHLDERSGGMMIPAAGLSEAEIKAFAADDPAVRSGVLIAEVRPWLIGMSK